MNLAKHMIGVQKSDVLIAEQRKNDLIMYLAHDLKTPLAFIISYLSLLRDEKQISEELREKYLSISLFKAERLERIFEQFYRLDTECGSGGTGLGLAIARKIITLHKGIITMASENDLTVFTVTLPAL